MASRKRIFGRMIIVGSFLSFLLCVASIQVIGVYMASLSEEFHVGTAVLGWICSLALAFMGLAGPFASVIINKFGCRWAVMAGGTTSAAGMMLTYFATSTTWLFICLGIIPGIGASLVYTSGPVVVAPYFKKHYSTAIGIVFAGIGAGIFIFPPLLEELIAAYGWRGAVLICGALIFNTVAMGALFRPVPTRKKQNSKPVFDVKDLKKPEFHYRQLSEVFKGKSIDSKHTEKCGNNATIIRTSKNSSAKWCPSHLLLFINTPMIALLYLSTFFVNLAYAATITHTANQVVASGLSEKKGALALSLLGVGSFLGRSLHGVFIDIKIIRPSMLYETALLMAAAATFLNPIVHIYPGYVVSALCTGIASGTYFPLFYTILKRMVGISQLATATGVELFVDGGGIMAGGYLAGAIRDTTGNYDIGFYLSGATYILAACFFLPIIILERSPKTWIAITNTEKETYV